MSDADNQMGGTGGETGPPPGKEHSPDKEERKGSGTSGADRAGRKDDRVTEESEESFPASDPPSNY